MATPAATATVGRFGHVAAGRRGHELRQCGGTSGLDIGRRRLSAKERLRTAQPGRDRSDKVPAQGKVVNAVGRTA